MTVSSEVLACLLLDIPTHFWATGANAARRTIAKELLSSPCAINLADVNISVGIGSYHVRPVELARLAAAASNATQFRQVLPVDDIDYVIAQIGDVQAGLLRVGRKVYRTRRAANGLRSNVDLAHKTTLAYLAVRV